MIFIELTGGLGNQMFQYAYGRSLSLRKNRSFKYFFVHHYGDTNRQYELHVFNLKGEKYNGLFTELVLIIFRLLHIRSSAIISGYWQNPKYFANYEKEIREDFRFITPLDYKNKELLNLISKTNSVSVHVRRGDYVSDKKTKEFHGICTAEYYRKAIAFISRKVEKPVYFIFSDDLEWARKNIKLDNATYVNWNRGEESFKDMLLMSQCKHNIIANSSFSWWGAWLNSNPGKIVITPNKWFENIEAQKNAKNLIPKEWIKI